MKYCIIVIDPWKYWPAEDEIDFPHVEVLTKTFGNYLNAVLEFEHNKKNTDIYFYSSNKPIMDELNTDIGTIVSDINDIPQDYDMYYFCGYHYGRCIKTNMLKYDAEDYKKGILTNLSVFFPPQPDFLENDKHFLWHDDGIKEILISYKSDVKIHLIRILNRLL